MAAYEAKVMFPGEIDSTVAELDPRAYALRILAEGDSWFSFGSWKLNSLLNHLRFARPAAIVTLAQPGDTIRHMADICTNPELDNWLSLPYSDIAWNAVLVSGGGNDVIDDARNGLIVPPSATPQPEKEAGEYIDAAALERTLAGVRESYAKIVELRDRPNSPCIGVPLVTHEYDFTTPRDAPAQFLLARKGPWLYTAVTNAKIPPSRWNAVSDYILAALGATLEGLEQALPNFHVARTLGTLERARPGTTGNSNDWDNEIHPNRRGFDKLARVLAGPIEALT
jgi:hypothetical protein